MISDQSLLLSTIVLNDSHTDDSELIYSSAKWLLTDSECIILPTQNTINTS